MSSTVDARIREIDKAIAELRGTRGEAQVELEAATYRKDAALAAEHAAQDDINAARAAIRSASAEIDVLLEQRHTLIPPQRPATDWPDTARPCAPSPGARSGGFVRLPVER